MDEIEPKSLTYIWREILSPIFRIRDVETLEDYIVIKISVWIQGMPHYVVALKCSEISFSHYRLDGWSKKYAVLSTKEEIDFLKSLPTERCMIYKIKSIYRKIAT